jgi:NTE family protein
MDAFSPAEIAVLENHGYSVADANIRRRIPSFVPPAEVPYTLPHPQWMDENRVRRALRNSHKRIPLIGRW